MSRLKRAIDANANRAREAVRVMEDSARFLLDDATLSARLKSLRHALTRAVGRLPGLEAYRETPEDVGTSSGTPAERTRASSRDVVVAAGRRLGEALRAIEEFAKVLDATAAAEVEGLRYEAYAVEKALRLRLGSGAARQWRLCVILSEGACRSDAWLAVARACVAAGADCLQLREKALSDRALLDRSRRLVAVAREADRPEGEPPPSVVINDRPDLAVLAGADGVHLGQDDLPPEEIRKLAGEDLLVGVSTHDTEEAARAVDAGADYCGVGAVFASSTKERPPAGLAYVKEFRRRWPDAPHLAIGGIGPENARQVAAAGARGVAVSSAVCGARDPASVVGSLLAELQEGEA